MDNSQNPIVEHDDADSDGIAQSQRSGRKRLFPFSRNSVVLVTDARRSPEQNRRKREVAYKWLQGSRIPFLFASGLSYLWLHSIVLSVALFVISALLPWVSVVIANGHGEPRDPRAPVVYKPALGREETNWQQLQEYSQRQQIASGERRVIDQDNTAPGTAAEE